MELLKDVVAKRVVGLSHGNYYAAQGQPPTAGEPVVFFTNSRRIYWRYATTEEDRNADRRILGEFQVATFGVNSVNYMDSGQRRTAVSNPDYTWHHVRG